jgi:hypothetical protein
MKKEIWDSPELMKLPYYKREFLRGMHHAYIDVLWCQFLEGRHWYKGELIPFRVMDEKDENGKSIREYEDLEGGAQVWKHNGNIYSNYPEASSRFVRENPKQCEPCADCHKKQKRSTMLKIDDMYFCNEMHKSFYDMKREMEERNL